MKENVLIVDDQIKESAIQMIDHYINVRKLKKKYFIETPLLYPFYTRTQIAIVFSKEKFNGRLYKT